MALDLFSHFAQLTRVPNPGRHTDQTTCDMRRKGPRCYTVPLCYLTEQAREAACAFLIAFYDFTGLSEEEVKMTHETFPSLL